MLFPDHLNITGYCQKLHHTHQCLLEKLPEKEINQTMLYILTKLSTLIDGNKENPNELSKIIECLLNVERLSQEENIQEYSTIKPEAPVALLYWILREPTRAADLIENHMKISIPLGLRNKYCEFLQKFVINCAKELAEVNQPKPKKRVTFE